MKLKISGINILEELVKLMLKVSNQLLISKTGEALPSIELLTTPNLEDLVAQEYKTQNCMK